MNNNHNICIKTEVAVECAASVNGFIFRNYDLKHLPYPPDIQEIYDRNRKYRYSLLSIRSESELDKVLASIKQDKEYVMKHTPQPHR